MLDYVFAHWEYFLLGFYVLEKIIKATPTKKDDIVFDMVLKPIWGAVVKRKPK